MPIGFLCTGLINAWSNLDGSKHICIFLFVLETHTQLFHHSEYSSASHGMIICCHCSHFHLLYDCCSGYVMCFKAAYC